MLIDRCAHASPWRRVTPGAKAAFAGAALAAAYLAPTPGPALLLALVLAALTLAGARVPASAYLRVAAPALSFLLIGCVSLPLSLGGPAGLAPRFETAAVAPALLLGARALAALAALLLLILSTPLPHLLALLRRLRCPDVLLDLMVLCYRLLFVFGETLADGLTAQAARLGHDGWRRRLRALGQLAANLLQQTWQRARELQQAADARLGDGPLRFLPAHFPHPRRDRAIAATAAPLLLLAMALWRSLPA